MTKPTYQVFTSEDELKQYVIENDPMKEFVPVKKDISEWKNWNPKERDCNECEKKFVPQHPAQHFCQECQTKEDKQNKRESVIERMKKNPTVEACETCGSDFFKTAPAMRKCIDCSPKGGQRVGNLN